MIAKEMEAHIAKLEKRETHEPETYEEEDSVPSRQEHVANHIPTERRLSQRRTGGSNVHSPCLLSKLRKNMVATIQQSRKKI
jgi:hypothetical protein